MAKEQPAFDISNSPELERLAEEVRASQTIRILRRGNEVIAKIVPATSVRASIPGQRRRRGEKTKEDMEAFFSSAGGWKDVDAEQLKADIYASREMSSRPPVKL
jgi:hypothetical protein